MELEEQIKAELKKMLEAEIENRSTRILIEAKIADLNLEVFGRGLRLGVADSI